EQSDDVPEVSEPATPVPDETPEQSDDVPEIAEPETSSSLETIISEIPFDLKIKPLCRKCKLLGSCYDKHPSKVLEDVYSGEHCDDVCGDCTLCCSDYKPLISFPETPVIKYYVYINSMKGNRFELVDCATLHKAYIRFILLLHSFSSLQRNSIYVAYICDESDEILGFIRRDNRGFFFKPLKSDNVPETSVELSDFYDDVPF
ncbi:MAG: hypothetical protein K2L10_05485, partial [Ruminococcus sp.]|nr:hypothetical protein [Ruminococcus sp.]